MTMRASWWCSFNLLRVTSMPTELWLTELAFSLKQSTAVVANDDVQPPRGRCLKGGRDADFDGMRSLMATEPMPNRILDGRLRDQRRNEDVQPCSMLTMDIPLNNATQANLFQSDVLFEGVKLCTERVHSVTFFAPVCPPQLDETGKDLFGLVNSTFPPKPLDEDKALNMK